MGGKPTTTRSRARQQVLQLRIELCEIDPPIWRRVLVPADLTLGDFHHVIQVVMGWKDCHLHQFIVGEERFMTPHPENIGSLNEWSVRLSEVLPRRDASLRYWYDFGDDWFHDVVVEEIRDQEPNEPEFRLLDGERAGPPEDSGGPHGYTYKLDVLRSPKKYETDEVAMISEWLGSDYDSECFDVAKFDQQLQATFEPR